MREIKFRFWDKCSKQMSEPFELTELTHWNLIWSDRHKDVDKISFDDLKWMQYTGVKDSIGVEIYEGDIVMSDWGYSGLVNYEEFIHAKINFTISDNIIVIGNIYQNTELIE